MMYDAFSYENLYLINPMEQSASWESYSLSSAQEISEFYRTRKFITVFTTVRCQSLSWARFIQSTPSHS